MRINHQRVLACCKVTRSLALSRHTCTGSLPAFSGINSAAAAAAAAKSLQSCLILCDPIDSSPSGSPVPGILQARTPEWVAIPFSQCVKSENEVAQSCPTLCDPMDCSLPGSSAHGIFQQEYWNEVPLPSPSESLEELRWV